MSRREIPMRAMRNRCSPGKTARFRDQMGVGRDWARVGLAFGPSRHRHLRNSMFTRCRARLPRASLQLVSARATRTKLAAKAGGLPTGDPKGHVVLGSVIDQGTVDRCNELIDDALAKGAHLATGGRAARRR